MRTLRLSLAGTVIVMVVGGLSTTVVAQDDAETVPMLSHGVAVFDATMPYPRHFQMPTMEGVPEEGKVRTRDEGFEVRVEDISDPRLAGTWRTILNKDVYRDSLSEVVTVARRIDNAEGSWLGHFAGYLDPDGGRRHQQGILTGTGAYEGLTAIVRMEDTGTLSWDVHGVVFPGALPEAPEYPEPAE